jgi:hypothetical protein
MFAPDNKSEFDDYVIPAGSYAARLYLLVDLGHQYVQYPGKSGAWSHKIRLGWEIPELTAEFEDKETHEKVVKPRVIGREYTLSYFASAHLKVDIQSWIGRDLTPDEQTKGFALDGLLGKTCMLSIAHKDGKNKDGQARVFANVAGVMACPRGLTVPALFNPLMLYDMDNDSGNEVFNGLYVWLQDKIKKAKEFQGEPEPETEEAPPDLSDTSPPFMFQDGPILPEQMKRLQFLYGSKKVGEAEFRTMLSGYGAKLPSGLTEAQATELIAALEKVT